MQLAGKGGESVEGFVGRIDHDADGFEGGDAEERLEGGGGG